MCPNKRAGTHSPQISVFVATVGQATGQRASRCCEICHPLVCLPSLLAARCFASCARLFPYDVLLDTLLHFRWPLSLY